jgi:hypothetical protein
MSLCVRPASIAVMSRHSCSFASALVLLCLAGGFAVAATAQGKMTIYRCTDSIGNVTFQNDVPCPKGHAQQIRDVTALPSQSTAPRPTTTVPAPAQPATPATVASTTSVSTPVMAMSSPPQPPPALYQCRTWDDRDYLGDTAEPPASCMPLQTIGIDGRLETGAGSACEVRRDTCTAIDAEQLCRAWKKRVDEAEFRWKFAGSNNDERKAEYERLLMIYRSSACMR